MADPKLRVDPTERGSSPGSRRRKRPNSPPARRPAKHRRGRRFLGSIFKLGLLVFLWGLIVGGAAVAYFALTLPDTKQLTIAERRPSVTILADDGSTIATFGDLFGQPLTLKEMSPWLPKAVIATEDRRFYSHFGIDPIGLARALFADLRSGHLVQGGSTITQQLAKTVFLTPERSLSRKVREALLALWLERHFTKDQILEIYLNRVYLGAGTYGVDARGTPLFRQVGGEAEPLRERGDRRPVEGADPVQPDPRQASGRDARRPGARPDGRDRRDRPATSAGRRESRRGAERGAGRPARASAISPTGSPTRSAILPAPPTATSPFAPRSTRACRPPPRR